MEKGVRGVEKSLRKEEGASLFFSNQRRAHRFRPARGNFLPKRLPQIMVFKMSINRLDYTKWSF